MIREELTIVNRLGLHARAAAKLVSVASGFECRITLERSGRTANAKSIMGVMMLAAAQGTTVVVEAEGEDEGAAFDAVRDLVADRFGEEE